MVSPLGGDPDGDRSTTQSYNRAGLLGLPRGTPTERLPWSLFPGLPFQGPDATADANKTSL